MVKIATWNVNSVNARLPNVEAWLKAAEPDVVLLQEIKCESDKFPTLAFEALGYKCAVHGQKSYNGVAILSREAIKDVLEGLPGDKDDEQARYIEAETCGIRVASIYLPSSVTSDAYPYRKVWREGLEVAMKILQREMLTGADHNKKLEELEKTKQEYQNSRGRSDRERPRVQPRRPPGR